MIGDKQGSYTWDEWKFIAERCSEIDFGCRFESYGCTKKIGSDRRGCCLGCAGCLGYLKAIPNEAFDVILNLFDETNGFWNGDCRLPWKYRSPVCLSYRCAILRSGENKQLWGPFYKAVGLGDRQHIEILDKLPTRWDVTTAHHYK